MAEILNDFNSFRIKKTNNIQNKINNEINGKAQNILGIYSINNQ